MILFPLFIMAFAYLMAGMAVVKSEDHPLPKERRSWKMTANVFFALGLIATGFAAWMGLT